MPLAFFDYSMLELTAILADAHAIVCIKGLVAFAACTHVNFLVWPIATEIDDFLAHDINSV